MMAESESPSVPSTRTTRWACRVGLIVAVLGWLWPIGAGGKMPVGGDATQFSIGLMACLRESLRHLHWPLWNDLWGFGFPGLAESQMGVYYPPHWGYALLSAESAYSASLVAHFVWGAFGAAWLARSLDVSEPGSVLTGFVWATSGFFLIHLPHQWAYTVGSWMPWAWGLAWRLGRTDNPGRLTLGLAAVLAVQVLPGHFQLAFVTEVGVIAIGLTGAILSGKIRWFGGVVLAMLGAVPLAAAQWVPTLMLARLSGNDRGFEYLSGFALSPVHLVNYVAPGLWHRSPLWRPLAWDLFHTAPEEALGYVGLVPLMLAIRALVGSGRKRAKVRVLVLVGLVTLALSLGPYFPGFRWLIALPGFSFFRAPARWSLASTLALACLAGLGFDEIRPHGLTRKLVVGFVVGAALVVGLVVGGFELTLAATRGSDWAEVVAVGDGALRWLPWADDPGATRFALAMNEAFRPQSDLRVQAAQARLDGTPFPAEGLTLDRERGRIYARELTGTGLVLVGLLGVGLVCARRPRPLAWGLGVLTLADLIGQGQARPFDLGPIGSLVAQSPVLQRVAAGPRGLRTLDPGQNLLLVAGGDSATAYRTLNLPAPGRWQALARQVGPADPRTAKALQVLGIDARILDPLETRFVPPDWHAGDWGATSTTIRDPALAGWIFGADFARLNQIDSFRWVAPAQPATRAHWTDDPSVIDRRSDPLMSLARLQAARPLTWRSPWPERFEVDWLAASSNPAGSILIAQTSDPEWAGVWVGPGGETRPASILPAVEGLQAVRVKGLSPGRWTLRLDYAGTAARWGLAISAVGWSGWLGAVLFLARRARRPAIEGGDAS